MAEGVNITDEVRFENKNECINIVIEEQQPNHWKFTAFKNNECRGSLFFTDYEEAVELAVMAVRLEVKL